MKSNTILINSALRDFEDAVKETKKVAQYENLGKKEAIQLELITEEMMSLILSLTGETIVSFWIESEGKKFTLHLSTKTVMDREKRSLLISASSSRTNEAAKTFLGRLRDMFEEAMASEADDSFDNLPEDLLQDLANHPIEDPDWDGYERSVLRRTADDVKISIRGGVVDMTVTKNFQ